MGDQQKVIEVISKFGLLNYLESLAVSSVKRLALHPVFPITASPNWSDQREIILVENVSPLVNLLDRKYSLN